MLRREHQGPEEDGVPDAGSIAGREQERWYAATEAALPAALASLAELEQQVLIGYYFDERSVEDLAAALRLHPERVCTALQVGMRELRRKLGP